MTKAAFVCVGNAGRSQMAAALAERERDNRELDIEIVTGGVDPADSSTMTLLKHSRRKGSTSVIVNRARSLPQTSKTQHTS